MVEITNPTLPEIGVTSVGAPARVRDFTPQLISSVGSLAGNIVSALQPTASELRQRQKAAEGTVLTTFDQAQFSVFQEWEQNDGKDLEKLKKNLAQSQLRFQNANPSFGKEIGARARQMLEANGLVGSIIETQELQQRERIEQDERTRAQQRATIAPGHLAAGKSMEEVDDYVATQANKMQEAALLERDLRDARNRQSLTEIEQLNAEGNVWNRSGSQGNSAFITALLENEISTAKANGETPQQLERRLVFSRAKELNDLRDTYPEMYRTGRLDGYIDTLNSLYDFKIREANGELDEQTITRMNSISEQAALKDLHAKPGFSKAMAAMEQINSMDNLLLSTDLSKIANNIVNPVVDMIMSGIETDRFNASIDLANQAVAAGEITAAERSEYIRNLSQNTNDILMELAEAGTEQQVAVGVDMLKQWSSQFANQPEQLETVVYKNTLRTTANPNFLQYMRRDENLDSVEKIREGYQQYARDVIGSLSVRLNETITEDFDPAELDVAQQADRQGFISTFGDMLTRSLTTDIELGDIIEPQFQPTTGRVIFQPKAGLQRNEFTVKKAEELNKAYSDQLGQLVRSSAHFANTTDYTKQFELILSSGGLSEAFTVANGVLQFTQQIPREEVIEFNPVTRQFEPATEGQ